MSVEALAAARNSSDLSATAPDTRGAARVAPPPAGTAPPRAHSGEIELMGIVADARDADTAARRLVQHLKVQYQADRVALMPARGIRPEAVAPPATQAPDAAARDWYLLREEAALTGRLVRTLAVGAIGNVTASVAPADVALRHHHRRHAMQHGITGVMTVPLRHAGATFAYLVFERRAGVFTHAEAESAKTGATLVGPWLAIARHAERSFMRQAVDRLRQSFPRDRRAVQTLVGATMVVGLGLLATVALWRVDARVSAPAHVEGVAQRQLVAPVDGYLLRVLARPGDDVKAGQVLAELDDREMKLEAERLGSEVAQESSQADDALARRDRAGSVIHQARADASQAQLELTQLRLQQAVVHAPFDGIVVDGDLRNRTGSPVKQGDLLMTVAPSGHYRVLADVAERDIAGIQPGATAHLLLAADPDQPMTLAVRRVSPVGHEVEGAVTFEIEAEPAVGSRMLRPGLSGVMHVDVGQRPLWRTLAGRLADAVRFHGWAWGLWS